VIKNLSIKNFKSHKDSTFEFCENLNVIYGLSSHGKSAALNALRLLVENKPSGDKYISKFAKKDPVTVIDAEFSDCSIQFEKTKKTAKYTIKSGLYKDKVLTDLNKKVPDEVLNEIKMTSDNFSWQFDLPYLLFTGNGEISRKINQTIGIHQFDVKLKDVNKEVLRLKRECKELKEEARVTKIDIKKFDLSGIDQMFLDIKRCDTKIKDEEKYLSTIHRIKDDLISFDSDLIRKNIEFCESLIKKYESLEEAEEKNKKIISCYKDIILYNKEIKGLKILESAFHVVSKLESSLDEFNEKEEAEIEKLDKMILFKKLSKQLSLSKDDLKGLEDDYVEYKICPECGQELVL